MTDQLQTILSHLEALVAIDTQNPPRPQTADGALVQVITGALPGFEIKVTDLGEGCLIIDAVRGTPKALFNVHLDTVPIAKGWSSDPHALVRADDRAIGLGSCDIKGAAAVLFTLAAETDQPMRLVLTTDEEAGSSVCVRSFLKEEISQQIAFVGEPTEAKPVTSHRGILSSAVKFEGTSGHASSGGTSAVHKAANWIHAVTHHPTAADLRLNVGRVEGGVKPNMIAAECEALYGFRSPPGVNADTADQIFRELAGDAVFKRRFLGPGLPCGTEQSDGAQIRAEEMLRSIGLEPAETVNFWTEASLFAEAGIPAVVIGPGHIDQAHTANEWVAYDSLLETLNAYRSLVHAIG